MKFQKEIKNSSNKISYILGKNNYLILSIAFAVISFIGLYYFLVAKVADNDIKISVMMSGPGFITFSFTSILITSALSGILLSLIIFKYKNYKDKGNGIFGFIGSGIAAFGVGCPTCGAFLFGLLGMPLALIYLPFRGLELQVLGIIILLISIYLTTKSIKIKN